MKKRGDSTGREVMQTKKQKMEMAASELHSINMERIHQIMDSKGTVQPTVLLRMNGAVEEISIDTSPRLKEVNRVVGCDKGENITFAGQWEDVVEAGDSVLLILRSKAEDLELEINQNKLQPPFHEAQIRGDILLQRQDEHSNVLPFTLQHYHAFQRRVISAWTPGDDDGGEDDEIDEEDDDDDDDEEEEEEEEDGDGDEEEGEEGNDDDDDDDDEEEEEEDPFKDVQIDPAKAQARLVEFLHDYASKSGGVMPTDEELQTIKGTIYYMLAKEAKAAAKAGGGGDGDAGGEDDEDDGEEDEDEDGDAGDDDEEEEEEEEKAKPIANPFGFKKA